MTVGGQVNPGPMDAQRQQVAFPRPWLFPLLRRAIGNVRAAACALTHALKTIRTHDETPN